MAITLDAPSTDVVSLEEYVEYVERKVDVEDIDSICECAPMFRALLNNRSLIRDFVDRALILLGRDRPQRQKPLVQLDQPLRLGQIRPLGVEHPDLLLLGKGVLADPAKFVFKLLDRELDLEHGKAAGEDQQ